MKFDTDLYVKNLQGLVKIPTISYEDASKMDMASFHKLHQYLENAYPLVHKNLRKTLIGKAGLLYHWEGSGTSKRLPLMLIAHQDVVSPGDEQAWKYPPFSAAIDSGMIWGRGTTDCKSNIQGYFDAIELLLSEGYTPSCDVYMGLGYNEEIVSEDGSSAEEIADFLRKRNVVLGCLLDEGGGIQKVAGEVKYAFVYVAEKGSANFKFSATDQGGHSSIPGKSTALGEICRVACAIEQNPMPARLLPIVRSQLEASAPYMHNQEISRLCSNVQQNWLQLKPLLENDRVYNALIRTTIAATMAKASDQPNVLPDIASLVVNCRLLPGDSLEDLRKHFERILPPSIDIELLGGSDPPPVQATDSEAYHLLFHTLQEQFGELPVIPCMLYGGTDSKYYVDLCPSNSVYRFTCLQYDERWEALWHKVDERIPCDILRANVEFYYRFIKNYSAC